MLIYHPAYDAYHCIFRMLLIAEHIKNLEIDRARLLDFYLVFPGMIQRIQLPAGLISLRAQSKISANIYRDPVSRLSTFREMRHIQEAAIKSIAASGLIDLKMYENGYVTRTQLPIKPTLEAKIKDFLAENQPSAHNVLDGLSTIPLLGEGGLKHRSQLMEYRYDYA